MRRNGLAPSPSFTLFSQLPCELRLQIWHDSLPASEGSAVYFFRDWKWEPSIPSPSPRPILETDAELACDVVHPHVPVHHLPHVSVCYEAREVALQWAARHGLSLQLHERAWDEEHDAGGRVVVRPWHPGRGDTVYPHEREDEALVPRRWTLVSAAHHEAGGVRPWRYTDAPMGGGRYAPGEEAPLEGEALRRHVDEVEKSLLREVKRCEVESEARDAVEGDDSLPFTLEAVVLVREP
ncbi:hypothetical protein BBO_01333 [Beauveria brongniartii RCEF 3172]|uniref:2EXR domain-containing protein n=1 Tax=Beauveria brongniartii RCEF 3172 TaxID=1081107 RepID=A0A167K8W0_9HYPO|nr:hypothetical protein BBO_01333 [Beauveria brongniartii RCEF 3172]